MSKPKLAVCQPAKRHGTWFTGAFTRDPNALIRNGTIPAIERLAWFILNSYCQNGSNTCFVGFPTLARDLGVAQRHAQRVITRMERRGLVIVTDRPGKWDGNQYELVMLEPPTCTSGVRRRNPRHVRQGLEPSTPDILIHQPLTFLTPTPDILGTENEPIPAISQANPNPKTTLKRLYKTTSSSHALQRDRDDGSAKTDHPKSGTTTPGVRELMEYFCSAYQQTIGAKYSVSGGRDGKIFKSLLNDHSLDTLRAAIDQFLADDDEWLRGKRDVPVFRSRVNRYVQEMNAPAATHQAAGTPVQPANNPPRNLLDFDDPPPREISQVEKHLNWLMSDRLDHYAAKYSNINVAYLLRFRFYGEMLVAGDGSPGAASRDALDRICDEWLRARAEQAASRPVSAPRPVDESLGMTVEQLEARKQELRAQTETLRRRNATEDEMEF